MTTVPAEGQKFEVTYPFIYEHDPAGYEPCGAPTDEGRWRPGIVWQDEGPEDRTAIAHGVGKQLLTVVGLFKPDKFQHRVFYTQVWVDPDGRTFGKNACHVMVLAKFRRRIRGFGIPYDLETP